MSDATRRRRATPTPFQFFAVAVSLAGTFAWLLVPQYVEPMAANPWPTLAIVGIAVAAMLVKVDVVAAGQHMTSFVMTDAALVMAALLGKPEAVPIAILATIAVAAIQYRPPISKVLFNLGQEWLGSALAIFVFGQIHDDRLTSARTVTAAVLAGAIVGGTSVASIYVGSRLTRGSAQRTSPLSLAIMLAGSLGNAALALQFVLLWNLGPAFALLPLLPLALVYLALRGVRTQQHVTDRAEILYRATTTLHEERNLDDGLLHALEELRLAMRAQTARAVLFTNEGSATCAAGSAPSAPLEMTSAPPLIDRSARHLATQLPGPVLVRVGQHSALSDEFGTFASQDAVFAPVFNGGQPAGLIVVVASGERDAQLYQKDVDLVDVLCRQVGFALERGDLERSLSQLLELEQRLTQQAYFDAVTGLANRNFLNERLTETSSSPLESPSVVLLVDLDDFKTVNDSLGHVAGDEFLAAIAARLTTAIGANGLVSRVGGDEFAVLLPSISSQDEAEQIGWLIVAEVGKPVMIQGREVRIGASVGVRSTMGYPDSPIDVMRDADLALYNAKSLGKGRVAQFDPEMHVQARERLDLTAALATAVHRDEFTLAFQPIFDLETGCLSAVESLVRWRHPERGELLPGSFLPLTEQTGLIVGLGRHVLVRTLEQLAAWSEELGDRSFYAAVNVSGRQLQEPGFAEMVLDCVRRSGLSPSRLLLEITESVFIDDTEAMRFALTSLAEGGVRLGLDDFGTGYSSLSQLHRFPVTQLKIDKSFVARLDQGTDERVLVEAIVHLARALRMDVVAEGIETDVQLDMLTRLGCHRGQGWLLGRPQPPTAITAILRADRSRLALAAR